MNEKKSKVSIIITCYNLGQYLDEAVESVLSQTYKNIETIIVNDGSTDEFTKKVLKRWEKDSRVLVINIPNGGVGNARNVGIKKSHGEYICCLDADDKIDSKYIEKVIEVFEKNKEDNKVGIVSPWVQRFGEDTGVWKIQEFDEIEILWSNSIPVASVYKREVYKKVGGYDHNVDSHGDWEFWVSVIEKGYRWEVIKEKLFYYRVRPNSMIKRNNSKRLEFFTYIVKKHRDLYIKNADDLILKLEKERFVLEEFLKNEKEKRVITEEMLQEEKRRVKKLKSRIQALKTQNRKYFEILEKQKLDLEKKRPRRIELFRKVIKNVYKLISFSYASIKSFIKRKSFKHSKVTILSLDVFDTLLRRKVHPEEIKLATSQYIYLKFNSILDNTFSAKQIYDQRLIVENKLFTEQGDYTISEVMSHLLEELGIEETSIDEVVNYEISLEKKVLYKDPNIEKFLGELLKEKEKYFLSDFYIPQKQLQSIINKYYPYLDKGYVSCDYNKTKATGKLFNEFLETEKYNPSEVLHIGDSQHSDVNMAKDKGLNSLRYFNLSEELKRRYWSDKRDAREYRFPYQKDIEKILQNKSQIEDLDGYKKELYKLGIKYSPIFYSFVLNILESAKEMDLNRVYYFTREGIFFRNIHERILEKRKYLGIEGTDLEVSRVATFFVSLPEFSKNNLQRLWSQYKEQNPKSFFKSLGIEVEEVSKYVRKYDIDIDKVVSLSQDKRFNQLLKDKEFVNRINSILDKKKEIFKNYLVSKGVRNNGSSYMIVDIGWRGSIQDNLGYFLNESQIYGKYLGLHSGYYTQPTNVHKSAYGPNYFQDNLKVLDIVNWTGVWEMLTNSPMGSVHSYENTPEGITPVLVEDRYETKVHNEYIKYFQKGVLDSITDLDQFVEIHGISSEELRPYTIDLMNSLVYKPEHILTEAYFHLNHNETFGLGSFTNMEEIGKIKQKNLLKIIFSRNYRKNFYHDAIKTCWRNGYWKYNRINGIMILLTKLRYLLTGKL